MILPKYKNMIACIRRLLTRLGRERAPAPDETNTSVVRPRQIKHLDFIGETTVACIPPEGTIIYAKARSTHRFKPHELFVQQSIVATASLDNYGGNATAIDVFLLGTYVGGNGPFLDARAAGINCSIFGSGPFGKGFLCWPEIPPNVDVTMIFVVAPTILSKLPTPPRTFNNDTTYRITVMAQLRGDRIEP